jgi:glycosyltransferase involved in cell wall biosynthesis
MSGASAHWEAYRRWAALAATAPEQAEAGLRRLLSSAPGDARLVALCRNDIGALLAARSDTAGAQSEFTAALRADPACEAAQTNLAALGSRTRSPRKLALISLLFTWPVGGGGVYDTAAVGRGLIAAGYDVKHFSVTYPPAGIGQREGEPPLPTVPLAFAPGELTAEALRERLRRAVEAFSPDIVLISDSWNTKVVLLEALEEWPCFLRFHAAELLCPLTNIRFLLNEGRPAQCRFNFLATPDRCASCLAQNRSRSGGLHAWERALAGAEEPDFHARACAALGRAAGAAVNNPLVAALYSAFVPNTQVIPSGTDCARLFTREPGDPGRKTILMSGVVEEPMKGFAVLHEAAERLWAKRQDFRVVVTGREVQGPLNAYLESVGWRPQESLPELYAAADVCVVPSLCEEACGIVAIEAMAAGRPVVASRAGGLQFSVVDGLTGYLFAPGDAGELAERLETLLDDAARRKQMGAAARARAQQFDWHRLVTERYLPWLAGGLSGGLPHRVH